MRIAISGPRHECLNRRPVPFSAIRKAFARICANVFSGLSKPLTGITHQQVSKWSERVADRGASPPSTGEYLFKDSYVWKEDKEFKFPSLPNCE